MYSIVKRLRSRGARKHDREIQSDPGTPGDLTLTICGGAPEAKLARHDDSRQEPIIPVLNNAQLVTMHGDKMLFKGYERGEGGAEHVQEWSVLVTLRPAGAG
ncbi:hypothetical protein [Massilia sp. Leaf139]|uniref:hypothetical protein n=1 Tax=Massilia sp. Leaf139 TaxID=1736272 RepID=UPI0006FEB736|nr:hypothetical protein [Massilia sp. Leaf139]KQQ86439.1 hypothetical protein ASF77_20940 [Massilia sp. Leaf139]